MSERDFLDAMARASRRRAAALRPQANDLAYRAHTAPPTLPISIDRFGIIAEIKPRSPSSGALGDDCIESCVARANAYARGGAACVSVLTEPTHFGGSTALLSAISTSLRPLGVPTLRKDFLVDPLQVVEARALGASGVLVVARMVDDAGIEALVDTARVQGMFALIEVFDEGDLDRCSALVAWDTNVVMVGVNTRDLTTLAVDRERLATLAPLLPSGAIAVAESGIHSTGDAARAAELGYRAALVGTALMRSEDPERSTRALVDAGRHSSEGGRCA